MFRQLCKSKRIIVGPLDSTVVSVTDREILKVFLILISFRLCGLFFLPKVLEVASHYI
jgi:hypothetical protein